MDYTQGSQLANAVRDVMKQRNRTRAVDESLRRLSLVAEGVKTCVVVSADGLAIAAYPQEALNSSQSGPLNAAEVAAISARLAGLAESSLNRLAQGRMGRLLLEGEQGTLLSCPAGDVTLALLVEPGASMGHVLFAAQKAAAEIGSILART